jgi:hypothetical protein
MAASKAKISKRKKKKKHQLKIMAWRYQAAAAAKLKISIMAAYQRRLIGQSAKNIGVMKKKIMKMWRENGKKRNGEEMAWRAHRTLLRCRPRDSVAKHVQRCCLARWHHGGAMAATRRKSH